MGEVEGHNLSSNTRQVFRKKLREGQLDEKEIEIDITAVPMGVEIMTLRMEDMANQLQSLFQGLSNSQTTKRKMKIKDALKTLIEDEAAKLINPEELKQKSLIPSSKMGLFLLMKLTRFVKKANTAALMYRAKVCNVIYFRWSKAPLSIPNTEWSKPIIFCLLLPAPSKLLVRRILFRNCKVVYQFAWSYLL